MKKTIVGILLMVAIVPLLMAQHNTADKGGINFFHGTWEEVLQEAKNQNKPIFVDTYTSWCGPCKRMARQTFTDVKVGDFYNNFYVNYKIDAEKGDGPEFAQKYKVKRYPTLLYINPDGKLIRKVIGFRKSADFLAEGRKGLYDEEKFQELEQAYNNGQSDMTLLHEYAKLLWIANAPAFEEVSAKYLGRLSNDELQEATTLKTVFLFANKINTPAFNLMLKNRDLFDNAYGNKVVTQKIIEACFTSLKQAAKSQDKKMLKQVTKTLKKSGHEEGIAFSYLATAQYYEAIEDWKKYAKAAVKYLDKYEQTEWEVYNQFAWRFYEYVNSKKYLEKAESWAAQSIVLKSTYYNNDTYAALLYKQGRINEAIAAAEKAISIAKIDKVNSANTQQLLDKMMK